MTLADESGESERCVVVYAEARNTLRPLRPLVRVVLEDVALDAVWRDGRLVAPTSARLVAQHLGIDAGTAAAALRVLRERGFVELEQHAGRDGRFGLAGYVVHLPTGIELVRTPCADRPHAAAPRPVKPTPATNHAAPRTGRRRAASSMRSEQGALDLGLGTR